MTFRTQFCTYPTVKRKNLRTYPSEKKDAEAGDGGQAAHTSGLSQRWGAERVQGLHASAQPLVELAAALPDRLVYQTLHKKNSVL